MVTNCLPAVLEGYVVLHVNSHCLAECRISAGEGPAQRVCLLIHFKGLQVCGTRHYPAFHAARKVSRACQYLTAFPLQVNNKITQLALNVCRAETEDTWEAHNESPDFSFSERVPSGFDPQAPEKKQLWEHVVLKGQTDNRRLLAYNALEVF